MNDQTTSVLHSVDDAAKTLGVAPVTVRRAVKDGLLSHVRIGDRILFRDEDLEAFVSRSAIPAKEAVR